MKIIRNGRAAAAGRPCPLLFVSPTRWLRWLSTKWPMFIAEAGSFSGVFAVALVRSLGSSRFTIITGTVGSVFGIGLAQVKRSPADDSTICASFAADLIVKPYSTSTTAHAERLSCDFLCITIRAGVLSGWLRTAGTCILRL